MKVRANKIEHLGDFEDLNQLQILNNRLNFGKEGKIEVEFLSHEYFKFLAQVKETEFEIVNGDTNFLKIKNVGKVKII